MQYFLITLTNGREYKAGWKADTIPEIAGDKTLSFGNDVTNLKLQSLGTVDGKDRWSMKVKPEEVLSVVMKDDRTLDSRN